MHHLAGINPFQHPAIDMDDTGGSNETTQTRFSLARWLIIDELFMASAQFFAEFEIAIRNAVAVSSSFRKSKSGPRPWGGLNVVGVGDAYQLDCPEGTPLYRPPRSVVCGTEQKEDPALLARGLALLWDQKDGQGFQSVLDLTQPFRCADAW